jgi:methylenetetrahydrofolate dehydrogenase (NADP+)/methenyltetrahydrofolate cyclohydrolase
MEIIARFKIPTKGKKAVIIGRSNLVGRPLTQLLSQKSATGDATVCLCHSRTENLADETRSADIVIAAVGIPHLVKGDMVKPGAAVIDVGINQIADSTTKSGTRLVGDVDFASVKEVAGWITPVPGGVGPMTVAMLLANGLAAARRSMGMD